MYRKVESGIKSLEFRNPEQLKYSGFQIPDSRLPIPFILGLTGSIGMGKSTVARQFKQLGAVVSDADKVVHALMRPGSAAFDAIAHAFPDAVIEGAVDRRALGKIVFENPAKLARLEAILHPQVRAFHHALARKLARWRQGLLVLEIPLLFESGADAMCDAVAVVTAPAYIQKQRVLARLGMTEQKFHQILLRQLSDAEKRVRADFIIQTGLGKAHSLRQVKQIINDLNQ
jgi:dephospho-CoA kinase